MADSDAVLAASLGTLGNVGGAVVQGSANKRAAKANYKYGEKAAENQYARQLDYWNKLNQYNESYYNPKAVYSRELEGLKANGLSPGLFYAQNGGGVPGSAGVAVSGAPGNQSAGTQEPVRGEGYIRNIMEAVQLAGVQAQIENVKAQTRRTNVETDNLEGVTRDYIKSQTEANIALADNTQARTIGQRLSNQLEEATLPLNVEMAESRAQQLSYELDLYIDSLERSHYDTRFASESYDYRIASLREDVQLKATGVAVNIAQAYALASGIELNDSIVRQIETAIDTEINYGRPRKQKELDWFTADKVADYVQGLARTAATAIGARAVGKGLQNAKPRSPRTSYR